MVSVVGVATLLFTLSILIVSTYHLYLSEFKERRSDVYLVNADSDDQNKFNAGRRDEWNGTIHQKIINTGEKAGYIADIDNDVVALVSDENQHEPESVEVTALQPSSSDVSEPIEPGITISYRPRLDIASDDAPELFVDHDYALVETTITVEDNKGAYTVTESVEVELYGPSMVRREYHSDDDQN